MQQKESSRHSENVTSHSKNVKLSDYQLKFCKIMHSKSFQWTKFTRVEMNESASFIDTSVVMAA